MSLKDTIFSMPLDSIAGFEFDQSVAGVFSDMIQRSVPGYTTIVKMIGELAGRYAQPNSVCYDLGCSLGASSLAMQRTIDVANCKIIGVDNSEAMLEKGQQLIQSAPKPNGIDTPAPIELIHSNLQDIVLSNASVVVLNFTLQFIPLSERDQIIDQIYQSLLPGGVLILSEKVSFSDPEHQELMIELHHNFKRANGYSDLEVAQKRTALENRLIPETLDAHRIRLKKSGFDSCDVWFQCLNFASLLAIKS